MPLMRILVAASLALLAAAASAEVRIIPQDSGVKVRLRGIAAVNADIAWASGREGTVLRTVDGGKHWQAMKVPGADELDFRDVEGFDAETAVVLSIGPGEASRVYRTEDAGKTWKLSLQNKNPKAFFDCMAFEGSRGWMLGDPVDGRFEIYATSDAGNTWKPISGPKASENEAAFAASGTCIADAGGNAFVVTGGAVARAHLQQPGHQGWFAMNGIPASASSGFFSAAVSGDSVLMIGGDYKAESSPGMAAMVHAGRKPLLKVVAAPRGYRSGAACIGGQLPCVAVGPSGSDSWNGKAWSAIEGVGYDAVDLAGKVGWASGDEGRIGRVAVSE